MKQFIYEYKYWNSKYEQLKFMQMVHTTTGDVLPMGNNKTELQQCVSNMTDILTQACWEGQISPTDFVKMCKA